MSAMRFHPGSREKRARIRNRLREQQLEASSCQQECAAVEFSADACDKRRMLMIVVVTRRLGHQRDVMMLYQLR
jgi:hypothetical protein